MSLSPNLAKHAKEGGHWYDCLGNQVAEVPDAKGNGMVKPDIRHARKLQLAPGVTTIIGCAAREDLVVWKQQKVVEACIANPIQDTESASDYAKRMIYTAGEIARNAADEGTKIHAAIQEHLSGNAIPDGYDLHVKAAMDALEYRCGKRVWRAEVACVSRLGYGTKADAVSDEWLVDWKGTDKDLAEVTTYATHWMQLAATVRALDKPLKTAIGYVHRTIKGAAIMLPVSDEQLAKGWRMFRSLLAYWQAERDYCPDWAVKE